MSGVCPPPPNSGFAGVNFSAMVLTVHARPITQSCWRCLTASNAKALTIPPKTNNPIGLHQITDITDLYYIENSTAAEKLQTLQTLQILQILLKMTFAGSWSVVRGAQIQHSLFRLKIMVGCLTSTFPSIHFFLSLR